MRVRSFVLAALLSAASVQSQALADGTIAIAQTSDGRDFSIGVSFDLPSRAAADDAALGRCRELEEEDPDKQVETCHIVATYDNQCMALAKDVGDGGTVWGWGYDDLQADADDRALRNCRGQAGDRAGHCEVTMRYCDGGAGGGK